MNIFITGHKGKLGKVIVDSLKDKYNFIGYDIRDNSKNDINDRKRMEKLIKGCDCVIHAAALPYPRQGKFDDYFNTNVTGTVNVIKAASEKVNKFIFLSSIGYYGCNTSNGIKPAYFPIDEDHPSATQGRNYSGKLEIYDQSKAIGEHFLEFFASHGHFQAIALRIAPANSKRNQYPKDKKWLKDPRFREKCFWSNCDPLSLANAIDCCINIDKHFVFEPFNIGDLYSHKEIDLKQFVNDNYPDTPIKEGYDFTTSLYSCKKAQLQIGFQPLEDKE